MNIPADLSMDELIKLLDNKVKSELPIVYKMFTFTSKTELYIEQIITAFLKVIQHEHMKDFMIYLVKELISNAIKANTKRIYFDEKGLNLNNVDDYWKGMATFKEETVKNSEYYARKQEEKGLYIEFSIQRINKIITIEMKNNVKITNIEEKRIKNKIKQGKKYIVLEDAATDAIDTTEGYGLGLIILMLLMKKMGIKGKLKIQKEEKLTGICIKLKKLQNNGT